MLKTTTCQKPRASASPAESSESRACRAPGRVAQLLLACCAGWYIMELEILGGRILTLYFGGSIYVVWGSVIGVFLLSLSAGYLLGGWLSQKGEVRGTAGLALCLGVAAIWIAGVVVIDEPVCLAVFEWISDEKWGALAAALVLFGVPTTLLATVSPVVVRRLTPAADQSGLSAGVVLCLGTVASFAGCIVTAFYLVNFSMARVLLISGGLLLLPALGLLKSAIRQGSRPPQQEAAE